MRLGILATKVPYQQHTAPVWSAIGAAERERYCTTHYQARGAAPSVWLVAALRDLMAATGRIVMMEHGPGLQFYSPPELVQISRRADVLATPNAFVAGMYGSTITKRCRIEIVGTPKMDALVAIPPPRTGTVAVSFHWTGGTRGLERYREALVDLARSVPVLGHAHPRLWGRAKPLYEQMGIQPVECFDEVVRSAEIYCCDHSSTLYEWAALGRPVVLLDRGAAKVPNGSGLRYTSHFAIGPEAEPATLAAAISSADEPWYAAGREEATSELYPHLGAATGRLVELLRGVS